ncbi:hypothetical protein AAE478_001885 [Parahypoxylon ruwenzoriense]
MKHFASLFGLAVAASIATVDAHTVFTTLFINDVSQGDGTCVRMNMDPQSCTDPVADLDSDDMACGRAALLPYIRFWYLANSRLGTGGKPVAFTCPAPAGGKLTFQWRLWADAEQPGALDPSHKVKDMQKDPAAGPGWIKLWEDGYNSSSGKWCTEKVIDNDGLMSINIPKSLPGGNWLFRPELLALHDADKGDPQFYTGCAQVFIESRNAAPLNVPKDQSVSIPGYVRSDEPALSFNIYEPQYPYPMPGPKVYEPAKSKVSAASHMAIKQTEGKIPSDYLIKNANWVGVEVPDYSTEDGCWQAAWACWEQAQECYDSAPPTGSANCRVWEKKCDDINAACNALEFTGPPNKGQRLREKESAPPISIPGAANAARR